MTKIKMRNVFSIVLYLFSVLCISTPLFGEEQKYLSKVELPEGWRLEQESLPEVPVFVHKIGNITETVAFIEAGAKFGRLAVPRSLKEFKAKLEKSVNSEANYFGSEKWKVSSIDRVLLPKGVLFKVRGSYIGATKQLVIFEEWKFYLDRGFAQITFSREGKNVVSDVVYIEKLLKRFSPFGERI